MQDFDNSPSQLSSLLKILEHTEVFQLIFIPVFFVSYKPGVGGTCSEIKVYTFSFGENQFFFLWLTELSFFFFVSLTDVYRDIFSVLFDDESE